MLTSPKDRKESIPQTEKLGDLITAEHKVLNVGSELRNNHQFSVLVQDLAIQWIQSYPCETKTSQETEKNLTKVSRAVAEAKSYSYERSIRIWQAL